MPEQAPTTSACLEGTAISCLALSSPCALKFTARAASCCGMRGTAMPKGDCFTPLQLNSSPCWFVAPDLKRIVLNQAQCSVTITPESSQPSVMALSTVPPCPSHPPAKLLSSDWYYATNGLGQSRSGP
ncbi:unnamed protein product [Phytophthora fragariaefolia]|uniref:Unnamed protein product n=1 Tax=Phytophthora fragariaefolia TaxID=1490495 RepID=A0A9W6XCP2_9STRA|nr:unnamed protein product [Phytophthora fragariaefolia]